MFISRHFSVHKFIHTLNEERSKHILHIYKLDTGKPGLRFESEILLM
jgi:hypothetical protein